jgi:BlaI family transcriptional regulator, penicillinase repressor
LTHLPHIEPVNPARLVTERKLTPFELRLMDALWTRGASSVREIHEEFPERDRPAYTTIQTMVYRLEAKGAVRRVKKIGNAYIFEATVSKHSMARRLVDDLVEFFGGRSMPVVAHLIEAGRLTAEDVQSAEQLLRQFQEQQKR